MATFAGAPPGSGANFRALEGSLAKRGARNPGALAAYIGRKKYGRRGFAKLSHHSNPVTDALLFADAYGPEPRYNPQNEGQSGMGSGYTPGMTGGGGGGGDYDDDQRLHVHTHGHRHADGINHSHEHTHDHLHVHPDSVSASGPSGTNAAPGPAIQTPQPEGLKSIAGMNPGQVGFRSSAPTAAGYSNEFTFAGGRPRIPVQRLDDLVLSRGGRGQAVLRHRRGGDLIGEINHKDDGTWSSIIDGRESEPRTQQRAALMDLIGTYNLGASTPFRSAIQPAPVQTPLMQQYGIPAVRALATPSNGMSDGGRMTSSGAGSDGLTPKGRAIYAKLCKRMPAERAMIFAKRAQNFGG